jgi:hypothetical protein
MQDHALMMALLERYLALREDRRRDADHVMPQAALDARRYFDHMRDIVSLGSIATAWNQHPRPLPANARVGTAHGHDWRASRWTR